MSRYEALEFTMEAAQLLGLSERTLRRWCCRYEEAGEADLLDRHLGKASGKRVPLDREFEVETLYRTRYSGFTAKYSTNFWCAIIGSAGVTPGRRHSCIRKAF
ncbi:MULTISPECIES: helix-turn-helix domain-containing protein [unclassified Mesorhizobium]|uniref:helix-turn-helix domain-containing protein n=1 Tax=unclassified Mesorhizobium TaxID=325217 RepID=UPI0033385AC7